MSTRNIGRSILLFILSALWAQSLVAADAADTSFYKSVQPVQANPEEMMPMTFTKLLTKNTDSYEIGMAGEDVNIFILNTLRKYGYKVVGSENILFGVDKSAQAKILLGGTITGAGCLRTSARRSNCYMDISWELFNAPKQKVVYRTKTVSSRYVSQARRFKSSDFQALLQANVKSLLQRNTFFAHVKTQPNQIKENTAYELGHYQICDVQSLILPKKSKQAIDATVLIRNGNAHGSGVFVSPDGIILTANHVVEGQRQVEIYLNDGSKHTADVLRVQPDRDVALLRISAFTSPCLPVATKSLAPGSEVFAIGAPLDLELAFSVSKGIVSGIRTIDEQTYIQTDASLNAGNSGGPLLNANGQVIGIVVQKAKGFGVEGIAFATPANGAMLSMKIAAGESTHIPKVPTKPAANPLTLPTFDPPDRHAPNAFPVYRPAKVDDSKSKSSPNEEGLNTLTAAGIGFSVIGGGGLIVTGSVAAKGDMENKNSVKLFAIASGATFIAGMILAVIGVQQKMKKSKQSVTIAPSFSSTGAAFQFSSRF